MALNNATSANLDQTQTGVKEKPDTPISGANSPLALTPPSQPDVANPQKGPNKTP